MNSIVEKIYYHSVRTPENIAVISGERKISYSSLWRKVLISKELLRCQLDITIGDRIIISASNEPEFIYIYLAGHLCGAIITPIDPNTKEDRLKLIIRKTSAKIIIGFNNIGQINHTKPVPISMFDNIEMVVNDSILNFPEMNKTADIIFTTGTTGEAKGVELSHLNISSSAVNINNFIKNKTIDVELIALPISHSFGLGRLRCILSAGGCIVLLGSFANVKKLFLEMKINNVSGFAMVPSSWQYIKRMSGSKIKAFASQLKYIEIGSAFMGIEDKHLLISLLPNTRIYMHYGLTEASRSTFIEFHSQKEHLNTIGKATPPLSIAIFNEAGEEVVTGEEGEICVKGNCVMKGYWNDQERTKSSFYNDYFKTGDWGHIDKDGYINLKSRKKELINIGGKKVSPLEVEGYIKEIDGVYDCACIGVTDPDNLLGEVVKAFIAKHNDSSLSINDIQIYLEKKLEYYKRPKCYEWISYIPKTASGKVQRSLLK
jgi:long-chain acyl-CoA synthetase